MGPLASSIWLDGWLAELSAAIEIYYQHDDDSPKKAAESPREWVHVIRNWEPPRLRVIETSNKYHGKAEDTHDNA
jgi:hypothetical protein